MSHIHKNYLCVRKSDCIVCKEIIPSIIMSKDIQKCIKLISKKQLCKYV